MKKLLSSLLVISVVLSIALSVGIFNVGATSVYPKIDLSSLLGGLEATDGANNFVGWDSQCNVITAKSNMEAGWGAAKASLIDGRVNNGFTGNSGNPFVWAYFSNVGATDAVDESIALNLQELYKVDQVSFSTFAAGSGQGMPRDFTIDVSSNSVDWTTVVTETNYAPVAGQLTYSFSFAEQICQYVRISVTKINGPLSGADYYLLLTEMEVNGISSKIDMSKYMEPYRLDPINGGGRMMGWDPNGDVIKVSHSYEDMWMGGTGKGFLIDGNKTPAKWGAGIESKGFFVSADGFISVNTTADVNEWVQVNLQQSYKINKFSFYGLYQTDMTGFPVDFTIDVSASGLAGSWTTVVTETGYQYNAGNPRNTFTFEPVDCQYIRLNVTKIGAPIAGATNCYDLALTEIEISEFWNVDTTVPEKTGDFFNANDPNIIYTGRWEKTPDNTCTAYWGSSSFNVSFTGTQLQLVFPDGANMAFIASIDGSPMSVYESVDGKLDMTPIALAAGTHTLRVITSTNYITHLTPFVLSGLILETGSTTVAPTAPAKKLMELVGDSITDGWYGIRVAPYTAEILLGMDTVNLGYAGITLTDGISNWTGTSTGMEKQYFKLTNNLDDADAPDWNFTDYQPDAIMINLGTNDAEFVTETEFKITYKNFLIKLREKNPNADIYAVRPFGGFVDNVFTSFMASPIEEAVKEVIAAGDKKVYYIDTTGWLTADNGRTYLGDDLHPNGNGVGYLGEKLALAITNASNEEPTPTITEEPTPSITEEPTPSITEEPTAGVTQQPTPTTATNQYVTIGANGKLNLTAMLGGLSGSPALVGWDQTNKFIKTSKSFEVGWAKGYGKAFLIDGVVGDGNWPVSAGQFIAANLASDNIHVDGANASENINEYVELNLQSVFNLNKFGFTGIYLDEAAKQSGVPSDFTIQVSEDGITWKTVVTKTGYVPTSGSLWNEFSFASTKAQYIRLNATKAPKQVGDTKEFGYTLAFTELSVYGSAIGDVNSTTNSNVNSSDNVNTTDKGNAAVMVTLLAVCGAVVVMAMKKQHEIAD